MKTGTTTVILNFDIIGYHKYPSAPKKVSFLRAKHRHTFTVRVGLSVFDMDREKEIFMCEEQVKEYLHEAYGYPCQFGNMSCEMIAQDILDFMTDDGAVWAEVLEDGRGGARVENFQITLTRSGELKYSLKKII